MASTMVKFVLFTVAIALLCTESVVGARTLVEYESDLKSRLKLDNQEAPTCWDSMFDLQSCTGEVIMFFLNGQTYLGPKCCDAIKMVEHVCWPNMLGILGYTAEEGNMLEGYCDQAGNEPISLSPETKFKNPAGGSSP